MTLTSCITTLPAPVEPVEGGLFNLVHRASESFTVSGWLWLMVGLLGISLGYCSHCSACTLSARSSRGLRCTPIVAIDQDSLVRVRPGVVRRAKLPVGQLSSLVVDKAAPNSTRPTLGMVLSGRHKLLRWSLAKLCKAKRQSQTVRVASCVHRSTLFRAIASTHFSNPRL